MIGIDLAIIFIIFLAASIPRLFASKELCMTWDESYGFNGSILLENILKRDFSYKAWSFSFHPPVLILMFGFSYAFHVFIETFRKHPRSALNYSILRKNAFSLAHGSSSLRAMRIPSVILGSLTSVLVYILCLDMLNNRLIGLSAAFFLAFMPRFISQTSLAALDGGTTFFSVLTLWLFFRSVLFSSSWYLLFSGIALGLTIGSKMTGGIIIPIISFWFFYRLFASQSNLTLNGLLTPGLHLVFWLLVGTIVFFVLWPVLWKSPIKQLLFRARGIASFPYSSGYYRGTSILKPDFYLVNLIVTTPIYLLLLSSVGILSIAIFSSGDVILSLLIIWLLAPVLILSLPQLGYRDGVRIMMPILPPMSILAGIGVDTSAKFLHSIVGLITRDFLVSISLDFSTLIQLTILTLFVLFQIFECYKIHPYYLDYYNQFVGGIDGAKDRYFVGWWGEGMESTLLFIDKNAPPKVKIWIYGPESTAFYHLERVNLKQSMAGESLFRETARTVDHKIDESVYFLREGDLILYFPYYYANRHDYLNLHDLVSDNVRYIIIYRRQSYPGQVDPGNYRIIETLRKDFEPVYKAKIKDVEVAWVYDVNLMHSSVDKSLNN
jgi:hypothetical protein